MPKTAGSFMPKNDINYITKEAEIGNIDTWDFQNTQIPHVALAAD